MIKYFVLTLVSLCFVVAVAWAQPTTTIQPNPNIEMERLARQYMRDGEYAKALILFEKLYNENPKSNHYYADYLKVLLNTQEFDKAEQLIEQQQKKRKEDIMLLVDMGLLQKAKNDTVKSKEYFDKALDKLQENNIRAFAYSMNNANEIDYVISAYKKGNQLSKDNRYAYDLAQAYQRKGYVSEMIMAYLDDLEANPQKLSMLQTALQRSIQNEDNMMELQTQLYARIQKNNDNYAFPELLAWALVQQKDFEGAVVQMRALDRRLGEDGERLLRLASLALTEREYDVAIDCYKYVIEKGTESSLYQIARAELLKCRNQKITDGGIYTADDIEQLKNEYETFLQESGKTPDNAPTIRDLSHIYAYYLYDTDKAIQLLEELLAMPSVDNRNKSYAKLDLGDYYLLKGEIWEATLLYSQLDKALQDDILGEEARFKNAKLSYYNGDFEWSQTQLNVLKNATSELIANDALELSVFITDNMGLDTITTPMEMFARADLLQFQNKTQDALKTFDSIATTYPQHNLQDDILMARAKIALRKQQYSEAVGYLDKIITDYKTGILCDDALFALGEVNEYYLKDTAKAMECYQAIIADHPGSLFGVEARKRFRKLRGDSIN